MRRRTLLATGSMLLGSGCLAQGTASERASPVPTVRVARWRDGPGTVGELPEAKLGIDVQSTVHDTRVATKQAVADGMVAADPPDSFQAILGDGITRYARAYTVHALPDIIGPPEIERLHDAVRPLIAVDDEPVAVPVAWSLVNTVWLKPEVTVPDGFDPFVSAIVDGDLSLRVPAVHDPVVGLWVLGMCLLGQRGPAGYRAFVDGTIHLERLRPTVRLADSILAGANHERGDVGFARPFSPIPFPDDWTATPFPGTDTTGIVAATGFCLPKRATAPAAATAFLESMVDPRIQETLVEDVPHRPAFDPAKSWPASGGHHPDELTSVRHWLPSMAVGCGLEMDARRRVLAVLAEHRGSAHEVAAQLRAAVT